MRRRDAYVAAAAAAVLGGGGWLLLGGRASRRPAPAPEPMAGLPQAEAPAAPFVEGPELEAIRAAARDPSPTVRWAAIELLHRMGDPQAVKLLEEALARDEDPSMRRKALALLRQARGARGLDDIKAALKDPDRDLRMAALLALGELGDASVVPLAAALLSDSDPTVRMQALHTIGRLQEFKTSEHQRRLEQLHADYEAAVAKAKARDTTTLRGLASQVMSDLDRTAGKGGAPAPGKGSSREK